MTKLAWTSLQRERSCSASLAINGAAALRIGAVLGVPLQRLGVANGGGGRRLWLTRGGIGHVGGAQS